MRKLFRLCSFIVCFLLIASEATASENQTHIHDEAENKTIQRIRLTPNLTKIYDLSTDSSIFHTEIHEFDAKLNRIPATNQSCKLTRTSFSLKPLSNLTLPSSIISPPFVKDDRFFVITDKSQLLCIELAEKEGRIVSQLNLPKADFSTPIISIGEDYQTLAILTDNFKVVFVNITAPDQMSLLVEMSVQLPKQQDYVYSFLNYKKHIFLAQGRSGLRVINVENKTAPKQVKRLVDLDFKTLSEINITEVWEKNGIMIVADTSNRNHKTYMLNVSDINQDTDIRRLREDHNIEGVHIEKAIFSNRPNFHFGYGSDLIVEFQDDTQYSQHNPIVKIRPSRVHVLGNGNRVHTFAGSNQTIAALTEKEIYFFNTSSPATRSDVPYNLLAYSRDIKGFENTTFLALSNRNNSIISFGSKNTINFYTVEFEKPQVECTILPSGSFRAVFLQTLSTNCSKVETPNDICVLDHRFLIGDDSAIFPQTYEFPNISIPVIETTHSFINSWIASRDNHTESPKEDIEAEKDSAESTGEEKNNSSIAYLLVLTLIIFVLYTICLLIVRKSRNKPKEKGGRGEGVEFQNREKKGAARYHTEDIDDNDESAKIDTEASN